jgi:hypothetical protein
LEHDGNIMRERTMFQAPLADDAADRAPAGGKPASRDAVRRAQRAAAQPAGDDQLRARRLLAQRFAPWLRRAMKGRGGPTYVWVVEAPGGGAHVHWAVHVPPALTADFRRLPRWVADAVASEVGALEPAATDHRPVDNAVGLKR